MRKIEPEEVKDLLAYERERPELRKRVIELKKKRRISLGEKISLVFENRETVLAQIHEMVRTERIVELDKIKHEVDVYNALIPEAGELSATLFIEITNETDIREELDGFIGLDEPGRVFFSFAKSGKAAAEFEAGHSEEERISAVQYVRFPMTQEQAAEFRQEGAQITLVVEHPGYSKRELLLEEVRVCLAEDLSNS